MSFVRNYALSKFFGKGSGGGGDIKALVERTITEIKDDTIEVVGNSAFKGCTKLTTADFPNCKEVAGAAFNGCTSLTSFNFDSVTFIAADAFGGAFPGVKLYIPGNPKIQYNGLSGIAMTEFYAPNLDNLGVQGMQYCASLTKVVMPALKDVQMNAFNSNRALEIVDLTAVSHIANAFAYCSALHTLVIRNTDKIVTFDGSLYYTKIASGEGYIYVTRAFLDDNDEAKDYRRATNWSTTGTQFRVLEDYTVDGTVTGELDESKI